MFYKKTHKDESSKSAQISPYGEPAKHNQNRKTNNAKTMLVAVSLRYPVVFAYICINIDFTIFLSKNKWKHKNRHIVYVSSVCSCTIIRKCIYFYIRWRPFWISPFWTFFGPLKKCNPCFSRSSWYFESESSEKSILTDKMHESVIWDIHVWAYTIAKR